MVGRRTVSFLRLPQSWDVYFFKATIGELDVALQVYDLGSRLFKHDFELFSHHADSVDVGNEVLLVSGGVTGQLQAQLF